MSKKGKGPVKPKRKTKEITLKLVVLQHKVLKTLTGLDRERKTKIVRVDPEYSDQQLRNVFLKQFGWLESATYMCAHGRSLKVATLEDVVGSTKWDVDTARKLKGDGSLYVIQPWSPPEVKLDNSVLAMLFCVVFVY